MADLIVEYGFTKVEDVRTILNSHIARPTRSFGQPSKIVKQYNVFQRRFFVVQPGSTGRAVLDGVGAARARRGRGRAGRGPAQHAVRAGAGQPPGHGAPPAGLRRQRALQRRRGQ